MATSTIERRDGHGVGIDVGATLQDAGVAGLWEYRLDENLVYADAAMSKLYGLSPSLAGTGLPPEIFQRAIIDADLPAALSALNAAIEKGQDYRCLYRLKSKTGIKLIEARGRAIVERGRTVRMTGFNTEIAQVADKQQMLLYLADLGVQMVGIAERMGDRDIALFSRMLLLQIGQRLGPLYEADPAGRA